LTTTEERRDSKTTGHVTVPIVDTDTHVIEPYDLWTSRADAKYRDQMPRVEEDPDGVPRWRVGERWLTALARYACAGLPKYPPYKPSRFEEVIPESFNPEERIRWMDEEGIYAACLYPNLVAFDTYVFMTMEDRNASLEAVRIYNDYLVDLAKTAPGRLLPITMVPFWDLDEAVAEIKRCHDLGHNGVLWANKFELVDLPSFVDEYWDPVYAAAAELDTSVNLHVGFAQKTLNSDHRGPDWAKTYDGPLEVATLAPSPMASNSSCVAKLVTSELPQRFPTVKFVSVEAGAGYFPYLMDSLDWFWHAYGVLDEKGWKPSEVFQRQCYASYSFETLTLPSFSAFPDNFLFSTDFPHDQSIYPGPCSPALGARKHVDTYYQELPDSLVEHVLYKNAEHLYGIDVPRDWPGRSDI
jgi:predicted TIM-barrel fold metal-dependent hydrolase